MNKDLKKEFDKEFPDLSNTEVWFWFEKALLDQRRKVVEEVMERAMTFASPDGYVNIKYLDEEYVKKMDKSFEKVAKKALDALKSKL